MTDRTAAHAVQVPGWAVGRGPLMLTLAFLRAALDVPLRAPEESADRFVIEAG